MFERPPGGGSRSQFACLARDPRPLSVMNFLKMCRPANLHLVQVLLDALEEFRCTQGVISFATQPFLEAIMPTTRNPVSTANLMGHPLHPILITLPIGLFVATFLFDLVFWQTGNEAFATGALWLLGAGLIGAALAAVAGIIDFLGDQRIRALGDAWQHAIGNVHYVVHRLERRRNGVSPSRRRL